MANEEQLAILKQGVEVWNRWRDENPAIEVDLYKADLEGANLKWVNLAKANLAEANLRRAMISHANLVGANLILANFMMADLNSADLKDTNLSGANLEYSDLTDANLSMADLAGVNFRRAQLSRVRLIKTHMGSTVFVTNDLSNVIGIDHVVHEAPSSIGIDTIKLSKGKISKNFLQGCGLSDWEIENVKLYNPALSNDEITQIQYKVYELRATRALQISPLFISYSHGDSSFVDKIENQLNGKGIRFWRDIHEMKAGRIEKQIDRAISQNRTVLLVLSEHSIKSDWVEHEVRTARGLEKDMGRDVLCPIALDDSWKTSPWPKRVMEQIMEYNILDFSAWEDDVKFEGMFRKLIDGLELFYKG